jgi:release factor glutamine methyltransferase
MTGHERHPVASPADGGGPAGGSRVADLVAEATGRLLQAGIEQPRLEARWLLHRLLDISESTAIAHPELTVGSPDAQRYRLAVQRRADHEPFDYIVGERDFWGNSFVVDRRVLIPREDTECLILEALDLKASLRQRQTRPLIVDVGTGSGAIACTLAQEMAWARVVACDVSADALAVAAINRDRLGLRDRLALVRGSLLSWLHEPADLIVANLPYIPSARVPTLMPEVSNWEPHLALDGGPDGLDLIRELLADAPRIVRTGGTILLEMDPEQIEPARALLPDAVSKVTAFDGLARVLHFDLPC